MSSDEVFAYTSNKHGSDGEDFFCIGVGRDVAKSDRSEARAGEVQSRDVRSHRARKIRPLAVDRIVQLLRELIEPACHTFQHAHIVSK